ncbi:MAG: type 4a pilus biogenesis protein PilO [Candidatus Daviesbacteria bacterium]|nr:type 4a pilus biogenesis protein PilO [Candidatus Daviesbacteria bacterium]
MKKDDLLKIYLKYKTYVFSVAVVLSSLFLILFVIYPQTIKLINNQTALGELVNKSKFLETKVSALERYDEVDLSRKVGFALATLPTERDFGNVLGLLQQLTGESGFNINSISFSNTTGKSGNSSSFQVKLEIQGSKVMLPVLLNNLENSPRLVRINSIDVASNQTTQALDVALAIEVLYSPLPKNFGSSDSPLPELSKKDEELIVKLAKLNEIVSSSVSAQLAPRGRSNPFE